MPDGRMLSKSIADNEELGGVSLEADYLFARCIPHLDREGRMTGNPALVKAKACPLRREIDSGSVPDLLRQLAGAGLVRWYEADGKQVLEFPGFKNHQKGFKFDREAESRYAGPDSPGAIDLSCATPDEVRTNSGPDPDKVRPSRSLSEVEVEVEEKDANASSSGSGEPNRDGASIEVAKQVRDVFEYWRTTSGHERATLTPDRRQKIKARLKRFSVDDLKRAIDGACSNPFHLGDNPQGQRYDFPETIFKSDGATEKHMLYEPGAGNGSSYNGHTTTAPVIHMTEEEAAAWSQPR